MCRGATGCVRGGDQRVVPGVRAARHTRARATAKSRCTPVDDEHSAKTLHTIAVGGTVVDDDDVAATATAPPLQVELRHNRRPPLVGVSTMLAGGRDDDDDDDDEEDDAGRRPSAAGGEWLICALGPTTTASETKSLFGSVLDAAQRRLDGARRCAARISQRSRRPAPTELIGGFLALIQRSQPKPISVHSNPPSCGHVSVNRNLSSSVLPLHGDADTIGASAYGDQRSRCLWPSAQRRRAARYTVLRST